MHGDGCERDEADHGGGWHRQWHYCAHALPLALFLAAVLTAVGTRFPDLFARWDATAMRSVTAVDGWVSRQVPDWLSFGSTRHATSSFDDRLLAEVKTDPLPDVTLVTLSAAAYSQYFHRTSPVPRQRLACVLLALSASLPERQDGERPVVAIDMDVTTLPARDGRPSTDQRRWRPGTDEQACAVGVRKAAARCPDCARRHRAGTIDHAMSVALHALAERAEVVTLVYPRRDADARRLRNSFIDANCCRERLPAGGSPLCTRFASPHLFHGVNDVVREFATDVTVDRSDLPSPFPGLGLAIADTYFEAVAGRRAQLGDQGFGERPDAACTGTYAYCPPLSAPKPGAPSAISDRLFVDDRLADPATGADVTLAYAFAPINFGVARPNIGFFAVDPAPTLKDLYKDAEARMAALPTSRIYILSAETGTSEDQFQTPVNVLPVPGAWLHAAIALTTLQAQMRPVKPRHGAAPFVSHVAIDLTLALALALLASNFVRLADAKRNPVLHGLAVALGPIAALLILVYLYVTWVVAPNWYDEAGGWHTPIPLLLGMAVHVYVEAAVQSKGPRLSEASFGTRAQVWVAQWLWAALIGMAAAYGLATFDADTDSSAMNAAAWVAIAAAGYVAVAWRWSWFPVPWRLKS